MVNGIKVFLWNNGKDVNIEPSFARLFNLLKTINYLFNYILNTTKKVTIKSKRKNILFEIVA